MRAESFSSAAASPNDDRPRKQHLAVECHPLGRWKRQCNAEIRSAFAQYGNRRMQQRDRVLQRRSPRARVLIQQQELRMMAGISLVTGDVERLPDQRHGLCIDLERTAPAAAVTVPGGRHGIGPFDIQPLAGWQRPMAQRALAACLQGALEYHLATVRRYHEAG